MWFMARLQNQLLEKQTNKKTAQRGNKHDDTMDKRRRQPSTGEKKKKNISAD